MSSEEDQLDKLLSEALKGNHQALDDLCAKLTPQLAESLKGKIPPDVQALVTVDDIMQETFVDVIRGLEHGQFKSGDHKAFLRWMVTIASHNLTDVIRYLSHERLNRHPCQQKSDHSDDSLWALYTETVARTKDTPSKNVSRKEAVALMQAAIEKLKGSHRQIIEEYYLKLRPMSEVAAKLGISEGAAFMRLKRALQQLRDFLGSTSNFF